MSANSVGSLMPCSDLKCFFVWSDLVEHSHIHDKTAMLRSNEVDDECCLLASLWLAFQYAGRPHHSSCLEQAPGQKIVVSKCKLNERGVRLPLLANPKPPLPLWCRPKEQPDSGAACSLPLTIFSIDAHKGIIRWVLTKKVCLGFQSNGVRWWGERDNA